MTHPSSFPQPKTYAIKCKDYVGAEYTPGHVLAYTPEEANQKAKDLHPRAWAVLATPQDEEVRAIEELLDAANAETSAKLRGSK